MGWIAGAFALAVAAFSPAGPLAAPSSDDSVEASGEDPGRRVLDQFLGAVSPDGRFITYTDWSTGDLAVRDLETGEARHLTRKGTWELPGFAQAVQVVSPEGRYVAYGWQEPTTCDLRVVDLAGSEPRILHRGDQIAHVLPKDWSGNGKQILAVLALQDGSEQVVSVAVADGSVRVLKTFPRGHGAGAGHMMAFSPDSRFVAYDAPAGPDSPARDIHLLPVGGGTETTLVEHRANDWILGWPARTESLFFASDRSGTLDVWALPIADGEPLSSPTRIRQGLPATEWAMFSRNGDFLYARIVWENDVYVAELDPGTGRASKLQKLIEHVGYKTSAEWSPDGRLLAYALGRGRHPDPFVLGIRSLETGADTRFELALERLGGHAFDLHWSPDGEMLLASGRQGVYRIDPRTGAVSLMVGSPAGCPGGGECIEWPVWASVSKTVFARFDDRLVPARIAVRNLETHEEQELVRVTSPAAVSQIAVSPDGRRLVFVQTDGSSGVSSLRVMSTTRGEPDRELVHLPALEHQVPGFDPRLGRILRPAWSPDGDAVFYATLEVIDEAGGFHLWRVSLEGGPPESLGLAPKGLQPYGLDVHPGGRRIALTAGKPRRQETWVIEGLTQELPERDARRDRRQP